MPSHVISAPAFQLNHSLILPSPQNISWQGRLYSQAIEKIKFLSKCINAIACTIFFPLNLIFANTWATSSICRKLDQNVLPMIEQLRGFPNHYMKLRVVLGSAYNIIDSIRIFENASCLVNGKYKNQSWIEISARALLGTGYTLEGFSWFSDMGLISSLSVGGSRIFGRTINGTLGLAHAFFAVDIFCKISSTTNEVLKKSLMCELAKHLGELSLSLMMVAGRTSIISLGVIGLTCIGLEILNLTYKAQHEHSIP